MNRKITARWLALFAAGLFWALPAQANEDEASLRKELDELKSQIDSLKENRTARLSEEIEGYLESNKEWTESAQGDDAMSRITITARRLLSCATLEHRQGVACHMVISARMGH